uniref:G-protein coupled receptors family 1 profile domain-containing protein n=1 Tax=Denticeps clupeoides TaxID=299321 RepID=A0AAY4DE95_9TELE
MSSMVATILPPVLIIELLFGLPSNLVALWIFCCRMEAWRANVVFLFNLMIADFLLLISLPFRIDTLLRGENWIFGDAWCRMNLFMLAINRSASIAFMTAVATDRYFKVVHPHHRINRITKKQAWILAGVMWLVMISLRLPLLTNKLLKENAIKHQLCRSFDSYGKLSPSMRLHYGIYILEFFLPFLVLLFCCVCITCILRQRQMAKERKVRRAIRTVMVIVVVFVVCFSPGILTGLITMIWKSVYPNDCYTYRLFGELFSLSISLTYLNSVLDPIIYCFSSSMFRNTLKSSINQMGLIELQMSRRGSMTSDA